MENFLSLRLESTLVESLAKINFKTPTPIQAKAIPVALEGKDILGTAQTGTGKTSVSDCLSCPTDSSSSAGSDALADCLCNAGYTGPNGGTCTQCAAGKFKTTTGSAACTDCQPGYESSPPHYTDCLICPAGEYEDASEFCVACPANSYTSAAGSYDIHDCV